ncbi:uncharacterized protein LOC116853527 [Odontomachus brunneus]|uniref:uncharacterized protein LOC116853527 n=1 Tax=Odontomachus brunneus TaxID=486640 RepID=UPI0013F2297E|nr:uncharacterized protein LOC116853527 [Odontomachus brunneus]
MMNTKKVATSGGSGTSGRREGAVVPGTPVSSTDDGPQETGASTAGASAGIATAEGRRETDRKEKDKMEGGGKRRKLDKEEEDVDKDEEIDPNEVIARKVAAALTSFLSQAREEGMEADCEEEESEEEDLEAEAEEEGNRGWPDPMNRKKNREFVLARIGFAVDSFNLIEEATSRSKRMSKTEKANINGHSNDLRRYGEEIGKVEPHY